MNNRVNFVIALLFLSLTSAVSAQQTVYVSDVLYVPLRSGAGVEYRIINAAMKSGTALTRLEESGDKVWLKVRTSAGVEGWIRNQYITQNTTAQIKLDRANARLARLEKENQELKASNTDLTQKNTNLSSTAQSETQSRTEMSRELEKIKQLSAGAIELDRRYQDLLQKYEMTQTQRDSLLADNENMKDDQRLSFLMYGAGILILGMLLAVILPALKPKKRYSEWS
ncbi:TIGR04211 family SH3 domain-containing protein [Agarilytica rhodophyticola]|uniref:TIGR04211 family SH3 domain-containing protein n=1 Tax=Agarilytica rhodophyticola TaxID=1737490 RepID=UPI000B348990|nr:TIGR04211 family SH3 domain-containing protein [Agarilytica rhodophyticola]